WRRARRLPGQGAGSTHASGRPAMVTRIALVALVVFAAGAGAFGGHAAEPTAALEGTVTAGGKALAGARVFVERAWPLQGVAYYCPGCYRDCGKSAVAD